MVTEGSGDGGDGGDGGGGERAGSLTESELDEGDNEALAISRTKERRTSVEMLEEDGFLSTSKVLTRRFTAYLRQTFHLWYVGELAFKPESRYAFWWNVGTMFWVMQAAFIVPTRLGFDSVPNGFTLSLDYISELWFLTDIFISCHMGYLDPDSGETVLSAPLIKRRYLHGWFSLDCISSVPVTFLILVYKGFETYNFLKVLRLAKIFRLIKLLKLPTLQDLEESGRINPSMLRFAKLLFIFLFLVHFISCGFWAVVRETCLVCPLDQLGVDGQPVSCVPGMQLYPEFCPEDWRVESVVGDDTTLFDKYIVAFNWSILSMLGDNPYPRSNQQYVFSFSMSVLGIMIFSSIIGSLSSMMQSMDSLANTKKDQLDAIISYLRFRKVSNELTMNIHGYYKYLWNSGQSQTHQNMFNELPEFLQSQLDLALKQKLIVAVPLFRTLKTNTIVKLCGMLHPSIAIPGQMVLTEGDDSADCMYFLARGKVSVYIKSDEMVDGKGNTKPKSGGVTTTKQREAAEGKSQVLKKRSPSHRQRLQKWGTSKMVIKEAEKIIPASDGEEKEDESSEMSHWMPVQQKLMSLTNGAHFGEVQLFEMVEERRKSHSRKSNLTSIPRSASVMAETHCELEQLSVRDFESLLEEFDELCEEMSKLVSKRKKKHVFLRDAVCNPNLRKIKRKQSQ
jgi:CRP-like cAMP-binding protein